MFGGRPGITMTWNFHKLYARCLGHSFIVSPPCTLRSNLRSASVSTKQRCTPSSAASPTSRSAKRSKCAVGYAERRLLYYLVPPPHIQWLASLRGTGGSAH